MINAGAIATTGLINGVDSEEKLDRILRRFEDYVGHPVTIDKEVYASERDTGHRNRAIAHLLRNADIIEGVPEDVVDLYFRQCSINVTAQDLALMGACLANSGVNPITSVVALKNQYRGESAQCDDHLRHVRLFRQLGLQRRYASQKWRGRRHHGGAAGPVRTGCVFALAGPQGQ